MFLFVYIAGLTAIALSQDTSLSQLPSCAQGCLSNATTHQGGCSNVDIKCLCSNFGYINVLACCLSTKCTPEDQQMAVAFNSQLCAGVNVTIPNFVGCAAGNTTSSNPSSKSSKPGSTSGTNIGSFPTLALTAEKVGTAVSFPSTAPVATFTGGPLLVPSCMKPQFASVAVTGGFLEYPWLGCSYENPECCPFDVIIGGSLSLCPKDYTTTSGACCPSGWSIYSSAFAGRTPCYSTPAESIIPPLAATSARDEVPISVITNKIFTLKYALQPQKRGLGAPQKAAIGIGASFGLLVIVALIFIFYRRRGNRLARDRVLSGSTAVAVTGDNRNSKLSQNFTPPQHLSELPSPPFASEMPVPEESQWLSAPPIIIMEPVRANSPVEMPGSTYLDEHHPAYSGVNREEIFHQAHVIQGEDGSDMASPSDELGRM